MFARYVVIAFKNKIAPIIVPPWDEVGLYRWVTKSIEMRQVLAAGDIRWGSPDHPQVRCSGGAEFQRLATSTRTTPRKSRGVEDEELFRQVLSHPVEYVVLNMEGLGERPILISAHDDNEASIAKFQGPVGRDVVSAGFVEFDLEAGHSPVCSGRVQLGSWIQPYMVESRGDEDAFLFEKYFVEGLLT